MKGMTFRITAFLFTIVSAIVLGDFLAKILLQKRSQQEEYFRMFNTAESLQNDYRKFTALSGNIDDIKRRNRDATNFFNWPRDDQDEFVFVRNELENLLVFYNERARYYNSNMMRLNFVFAENIMAVPEGQRRLPREFEVIGP